MCAGRRPPCGARRQCQVSLTQGEASPGSTARHVVSCGPFLGPQDAPSEVLSPQGASQPLRPLCSLHCSPPSPNQGSFPPAHATSWASGSPLPGQYSQQASLAVTCAHSHTVSLPCAPTQGHPRLSWEPAQAASTVLATLRGSCWLLEGAIIPCSAGSQGEMPLQNFHWWSQL